MPFLDPDVLIEYLNTYEKEILEPRLQTLIGKAKDNAAYLAGKNNSAITKAYIKSFIELIKSTKTSKDLSIWPKLIVDLARSGHDTLSKSSFSSDYSDCAFAVRASILNQINQQLKTASEGKPLTHDQDRARQIKTKIDERIQLTKQYLSGIDSQEALGETLELSQRFSDSLNIDAELADKDAQLSKEKREKFQRDLVFLANKESISNEQKNNALNNKLFDGYAQYSTKDDRLGVSLASDLHLPLVLQSNFDAIYLRIVRTNLRTEESDRTVVETFERQVLSRVAESKSAEAPATLFEAKQSSTGPATAVVTPSSQLGQLTPRLSIDTGSTRDQITTPRSSPTSLSTEHADEHESDAKNEASTTAKIASQLSGDRPLVTDIADSRTSADRQSLDKQELDTSASALSKKEQRKLKKEFFKGAASLPTSTQQPSNAPTPAHR